AGTKAKMPATTTAPASANNVFFIMMFFIRVFENKCREFTCIYIYFIKISMLINFYNEKLIDLSSPHKIIFQQ
ncbi:hypothetical protein ABTM36_20350, partial [Acinetobacter baumannii]